MEPIPYAEILANFAFWRKDRPAIRDYFVLYNFANFELVAVHACYSVHALNVRRSV